METVQYYIPDIDKKYGDIITSSDIFNYNESDCLLNIQETYNNCEKYKSKLISLFFSYRYKNGYKENTYKSCSIIEYIKYCYKLHTECKDENELKSYINCTSNIKKEIISDWNFFNNIEKIISIKDFLKFVRTYSDMYDKWFERTINDPAVKIEKIRGCINTSDNKNISNISKFFKGVFAEFFVSYYLNNIGRIDIKTKDSGPSKYVEFKNVTWTYSKDFGIDLIGQTKINNGEWNNCVIQVKNWTNPKSIITHEIVYKLLGACSYNFIPKYEKENVKDLIVFQIGNKTEESLEIKDDIRLKNRYLIIDETTIKSYQNSSSKLWECVINEIKQLVNINV